MKFEWPAKPKRLLYDQTVLRRVRHQRTGVGPDVKPSGFAHRGPLDYVLDGRIVLLYNDEIIAEYDEVLHRDKFSFADERIQAVLDLVKSGLHLDQISRR